MKNEQEKSRTRIATWYALMEYLLVLPAISEKCLYNRVLVAIKGRMTKLHPAIRAT